MSDDDDSPVNEAFLQLFESPTKTPNTKRAQTPSDSPSTYLMRSPSPILTNDGWSKPSTSPSPKKSPNKRPTPNKLEDESPKKPKTTPEKGLITPDELDDTWMMPTGTKSNKKNKSSDSEDDEIWSSLENTVAQNAQKQKEAEEKKNSWITPRKVKTDEEIAQSQSGKKSITDYFTPVKKEEKKAVKIEDDDLEVVEVDQLASVKRKNKNTPTKSAKKSPNKAKKPSMFDFLDDAEKPQKQEEFTTPKKETFVIDEDENPIDAYFLKPSPPSKTPSPRKSPITFTTEVMSPKTPGPNKIVSEDEEISPKKSPAIKSSPKSPFTFGTTVPEGLINISDVETLTKLLHIIYECDKPQTVVIGVLFRYNVTNFRSNEHGRMPENVSGIGILPAINKSSRSYFLSFAGNDEISMEERWKFFEDLIENDRVAKVVYGVQEALKCLLMRNTHLNPKNVMDPRIAAWILQTELEAGYDFVETKLYFQKKSEKIIESNVHIFSKDLLDCLSLWNYFRDELESQEMMQTFMDQEMRIPFILIKMEIEGIGIDNQILEKYAKILNKRMEELKVNAERVMGYSVQLSSHKRLAEILFQKLKLQPQLSKKSKGVSTKTGNQSTSEAVLSTLTKQHPLPGIILEFRHCQKLLTTYVTPVQQLAIGSKKDPRIHTTWTQTNTATGRLSSVNPNLQNLPRLPLSLTPEESDTSEKIVIRDAFRAREGFVLAAFDYSQIEMRILTHMSQDKFLLDFFKSGLDIHKLVAGRWLGKSPDKVTSDEREKAKRIVYGILYGMGPNALSDIIGVSVSEASKFISTFLSKFPGVATYLEETVKYARQNKHVKTFFNRRRLLPDITSGDPQLTKRSERQAVNSVIQGTAADMVKIAMIQADKLLETDPLCKNAKLLLQVHDELVFEVREDCVEPMIAKVAQVMEEVVTMAVEFPVKVSLGTRFGSLNVYDEKKLVSLKELYGVTKTANTTTTTTTTTTSPVASKKPVITVTEVKTPKSVEKKKEKVASVDLTNDDEDIDSLLMLANADDSDL